MRFARVGMRCRPRLTLSKGVDMALIKKLDNGWCAVDMGGNPMPGCRPCASPKQAKADYFKQQERDANGAGSQQPEAPADSED